MMLVVGMSVFQAKRERTFREEMLRSSLQQINQFIASEIALHGFDADVLDSLIARTEKINLRVSVIQLDGKVVFDNLIDTIEHVDNHLSRPEIVEARKQGLGASVRYSATIHKEFYYVASTSAGYIIRSALPYDTETLALLRIDKTFIYILALISFVGLVTLFYFTHRLGKNIGKLREFSKRAVQNEPLDSEWQFEESDIGDIFADIVRIYRRLRRTRDALSIEKEKLIKHLHIAKEGLAVFSESKEEILANPLFIQYINLIADDNLETSQQVFSLPEFETINRFIAEIQSKQIIGEEHSHKEIIVKQGRSFEIRCIVFEDNTFEISINNITRQEEQMQLKRQLTQNISHELKTPVSSIKGYLETIIETPVMDEDQRLFFLNRSYQQCLRLSDLLSDISALNRMDEVNYMFEIQEENISNIVALIAIDVDMSLKERGMSLQNNLPPEMRIEGNYSLLYSVFRNLFDNAIAYSGTGTTVFINLYREDADYFYLSFADNGNGVEEKHLNSLFDRFYRVDKGRSRKLGGTGLGLAIVKNAILFHRGEIQAKPRQGGGLEFVFTLKKRQSAQ